MARPRRRRLRSVEMKAVIYRPNRRESHGSWRPCSLTDLRGPIFPEEYDQLQVLDAENIEHAFDQYDSKLGDVVFFGEGDDKMLAYVAGPFGYEMVKFVKEWRSPE